MIISAIDSQVPELISQKVRLNFFGDYSSFGDGVIVAIEEAQKATAFQDPKLKLNIALGYGGRSDIIEATKLIANDIKLEKLSVEDVSNETIFKYLNAPINELDL